MQPELVAATVCGAADAGTFTHVATLNLPVSGVLATDKAGNLYAETGVDQYQGLNNSVLVLKAASNYAVRRTLYTFSSASDPIGYGLSGGVTLSGGMILGVTDFGGNIEDGTIFNLGKVSSIAPAVLSALPSEALAQSGLTAGPDHLYYGTTYSGLVFQIGPDPANPQYSVLHQLSNGSDGSTPTIGRLAADAQGRLLGLTQLGGAFNQNGTAAGTVFTLQQVSGAWQEQVVFSFSNAPGQLYPSRGSNIIEDAKGNLYACLTGGIYGFGGLIELQPTQYPSAPVFRTHARAVRRALLRFLRVRVVRHYSEPRHARHHRHHRCRRPPGRGNLVHTHAARHLRRQRMEL